MKEQLEYWRKHKRDGLARADDPPPPPSPYVNILGFRHLRAAWNHLSAARKAAIYTVNALFWLTILGMAYGSRLIFQYFTAT